MQILLDNRAHLYIVVYVDMVVRLAHFDLVNDLSVGSFLRSFQRHCNLFTIPESISTDNANYFVNSRNFLAEAVVSDDFKEFLLTKGIKHYRNSVRQS